MEKKAGKAFVASAGAVIIWQLLGEDKRRNIGHFIERLLGGCGRCHCHSNLKKCSLHPQWKQV